MRFAVGTSAIPAMTNRAHHILRLTTGHFEVLQECFDLLCLRDPQSPGVGQGEAQQLLGPGTFVGPSPIQQSQCDLGAANQYSVHIAPALEDPEHFVGQDAQGLIQLTAFLQDVGDPTLKHGDIRNRAESLYCGQALVLKQRKSLIELTARFQYVSDLALGDRSAALVVAGTVGGRPCSAACWA